MTNWLWIILLGSQVLTSRLWAQTKIRIAVMQVSEDGERKAPNIGIVERRCIKAKVDCEVVPLPAQRALVELQANRVQFLISLDHTESGPSPYKIAIVDRIRIIVVARKRVADCEDLKRLKLAAYRNVKYAKKLMGKCPGLKVTWTNTYTQGLRMYRSARVDGMIGVDANFREPEPLIPLTSDDIRSTIHEEDVWLFGNSISKNLDAAARLSFKESGAAP